MMIQCAQPIFQCPGSRYLNNFPQSWCCFNPGPSQVYTLYLVVTPRQSLLNLEYSWLFRVFCDVDHLEKPSLVLVECPAVRICSFPVVRVRRPPEQELLPTWSLGGTSGQLCWRSGWGSAVGQAAPVGLCLGPMFQAPAELSALKALPSVTRAFGAVI